MYFLFCMNILQISDSFRKFGLADTDKCVFVAIVDDQDGKILQTVIDKVQGELAPFEELQTFTDLTNVKKVKGMYGF